MNDQATVSMVMNRDLEPAEKEKVERLDGAIFSALKEAGYVVRVCQGRTVEDGSRRLEFCGDLIGQKIVAGVPMDEFLAATDKRVVGLVADAWPGAATHGRIGTVLVVGEPPVATHRSKRLLRSNSVSCLWSFHQSW